MAVDVELPPIRLDGLRCLVTGGSRGLGRALCVALDRAGAQVAFTYVADDDAAAETRAALGPTSLDFKGRVEDPNHAQTTIAAIVEVWGGLDVLVNNAATTQFLPIALIEAQDWEQVLATNVRGPFLFAQAALRPMLRQKQGHIVNIGSFGADRVVEAPVHYAASKGALRAMTEAMAAEVSRYGVLCNYVCPGLLSGGIGARLPAHRITAYEEQSALRRLGTLEEIAEFVVFLVSGDNTWMTGAKLSLDGGL